MWPVYPGPVYSSACVKAIPGQWQFTGHVCRCYSWFSRRRCPRTAARWRGHRLLANSLSPCQRYVQLRNPPLYSIGVGTWGWGGVTRDMCPPKFLVCATPTCKTMSPNQKVFPMPLYTQWYSQAGWGQGRGWYLVTSPCGSQVKQIVRPQITSTRPIASGRQGQQSHRER